MEGQEKQLRKFFSHFSTSTYAHDQKEIQLDEKLSTSQCCGFSFLGVFSCFSKKKICCRSLAVPEFQHLKY